MFTVYVMEDHICSVWVSFSVEFIPVLLSEALSSGPVSTGSKVSASHGVFLICSLLPNFNDAKNWVVVCVAM